VIVGQPGGGGDGTHGLRGGTAVLPHDRWRMAPLGQFPGQSLGRPDGLARPGWGHDVAIAAEHLAYPPARELRADVGVTVSDGSSFSGALSLDDTSNYTISGSAIVTNALR
jgi:hypothetical protein